MPHLILLHGALCAAAQLESLQALLQEDFQVHLFDFPGHGTASEADDFSIAGFAAALRDHIVGIAEPVSIFGYSMGGYVALYAARHFDLHIQRIITLGTKFDWQPETATKEAARLNPEKMLEKVPAFAAQLAAVHGETNWKAVVQNTATMMLQMGEQPPLKNDDYARISTKVHLLLGEADNMVSHEETKHVCGMLPNAAMKTLPDTKHPIDAVDQHMLAQQLKDILSAGC
jgi:pimeloyl-ACP methyl ester carboxylesterase